MRAILTAVLAGYLAVLIVLPRLAFAHRSEVLLVATTVLFAAAVATLSRSTATSGQLALLILLVGAALQLAAMSHAPQTSDDANRYLWDGKVQLAGVDPYRYPPAAPELARLREPFLFGSTSSCTYPVSGSCTSINRPQVRTIYPPVAEAAFAAGRVISFGGAGELLVFQILAALGASAVTVLLTGWVRRRGRPSWHAAVWAWCPITVLEFGQNGHIDWLAVVCCVLALQAGARRRAAVAGALLGLAIATKLYPVLLLPSLMRRRPWLVPLAAVAVVALGYLPHVAAVGGAVVGYLPGYLHEEGYASGARALLLGAVLPHPVDTVVGAALLVAVAFWAWRRSDPSAPEQTAVVMTGATFLLVTPAYGWYAALLVALAVASGRLEWIAVALAPSVVYLVRQDLWHSAWPSALIYLVAASLTAAAWQRRTTRSPHLLRAPAGSALVQPAGRWRSVE
jgi:hypothetical protein